MRAFFRFLSGYVCVSFQGNQLERFFSLCKNKGISIECLRYHQEYGYTGFLRIPDFFKLKSIRSKTGTKIHLKKKCGFPFLLRKALEKKIYFLAMLLLVLFFDFLGQRIWSIHITGNQYHSSQEMMEFLEDQGIFHGMVQKKIDCKKICESLRKQFSDIAWASVRIKGTNLYLTIREGRLMDMEQENEEPCDLVASESGVILSILTRQGTPLKKPGDTCEKGEVIVSGNVERLNDSQEITGYAYVHADADVQIARKVYYYDSFSMEHIEKEYTGEKRTGFFVRIGPVCFWGNPIVPKNSNCIQESFRLKVTNSFSLPVYWGRLTYKIYGNVKQNYTKEEAQERALVRFQIYQRKLMEKGLQISENNVKIDVSKNLCTGSGSLTVLEQAVSEHPLVQKEKPEERTAEDGW